MGHFTFEATEVENITFYTLCYNNLERRFEVISLSDVCLYLTLINYTKLPLIVVK